MTQVVLAHAAAGIKIQPCKTKLFQSEVEYLGHEISKGRVSMIPEYVQKEVARFLDFPGYYRTFISQYSEFFFNTFILVKIVYNMFILSL